MKTLIIYSNRSNLRQAGQTYKVANYIAESLAGEVEIKALQEVREEDFAASDCVLIGASVRYGHFDPQLEKILEKNAALLASKKSAFFSLNLTARKAGKDSPETNVYTRKLLARLSWQPQIKAVFAGALDYPSYSFFDRIMIQFIMRLTGGETDRRKSVEYTDWQKVDTFINEIKGLMKD